MLNPDVSAQFKSEGLRGSVLVIEDDPDTNLVLTETLTGLGFRVQSTTTAKEALIHFREGSVDVVVTDLRLTDANGIDLCRTLVANRPDIPVVVLTGLGNFANAVAALRAGAFDFITKRDSFSELCDELVIVLERALQQRALRSEVVRLQQRVNVAAAPHAINGNCARIIEVRDLIERLAASPTTVLITGESGTGKELVARALHEASPRRPGPFVAINCAAIPEPLFESELFGHAKGAFTDARNERKGVFQHAAGGTLFLDELGEMPLSAQVKLLRALQERKIRPVGEDKEFAIDVRIVAATHRDLETLVREGRFRHDLLYRINVVQIDVPPLRDRENDVLVLAQELVRFYAERSGKKVKGMSSAVAERMLAYDWPGNVRELHNCIERAVTLTQFEEICVDDLPRRLREYEPTKLVIDSDDLAELIPLEQLERRYILRVLERVKGNKRMASRILGLDRKTLYRRLEAYEHKEPKPATET